MTTDTEAEAVGETGTMPGTDGFTMAAFEAAKVPIGTSLFLARSLASRDARIEELEKDVRDWQAIAADRQAGHSLAEARALKAEALLEVAVKGLEAISFAKAFGRDVPSLEDLITDNRQTARATLTAITGGE